MKILGNLSNLFYTLVFVFIYIGFTPSVFALIDDFENHPGGNLSIANDANSMKWTTVIFNDRADCRVEVVQYNEPSQHWALIKGGMPSSNSADPGCIAQVKNSNAFEPFTSAVSFKAFISMYGDGGGLPEFKGHATIEVKFYDTDGILQYTLTRTCYSNPFKAARPCTSAPSIKKYEYKVISGKLYESVDGTSTSIGEFHGTGYIGYIEFQADIHRVGYAGVADAYIYIDDFSTSAEKIIPFSPTPISTTSTNIKYSPTTPVITNQILNQSNQNNKLGIIDPTFRTFSFLHNLIFHLHHLIVYTLIKTR